MKNLVSIYEMELSNIGRKQAHLLRRRRRLMYVLRNAYHKTFDEIAVILGTSRQYVFSELQSMRRRTKRESDGGKSL